MKSIRFILSLIIIIILSSNLFQCQPTLDDIDDLRTVLREEFDASGRFRDLLTATVRLAFHDCAGPIDGDGVSTSQCNGCIDFENEKHSGLQENAVSDLNEIYTAWSDLMNRADFWMAAATIAIEYAQELDTSSSDSLRSIPFYFGRTTCDSSDGDATDTKEFPGGDEDWEGVQSWMASNLGFNQRETVAIMGAHTLGRCHLQYSGYSSLPWKTPNDGPDKLNNQYYQNLLDVEWSQQQNSRNKWEWLDDTESILMLNVDICLVSDITDYLDITGEVACPANGCSDSSVKSIVEEYAANNQLWLDDFADAFEKMIQTGYSNGELTAVSTGSGSGSGGSGGGKGSKSSKGSKSNAVSFGYYYHKENNIMDNNDGLQNAPDTDVYNKNNVNFEDNVDHESYAWRVFVMYPILNGILLIFVVINTFIVCQMKLKSDAKDRIKYDLKYKNVAVVDSNDEIDEDQEL